MTHLNRRTVVGGILAGLHDGVAADGGTFDLLAHPLRVHVAAAVDGGVHVRREGVSNVRIRGAEPESAAPSPERSKPRTTSPRTAAGRSRGSRAPLATCNRPDHIPLTWKEGIQR